MITWKWGGGGLFLLDFWKWQIEFHPSNQRLWVSSTVCLHMLEAYFPGVLPSLLPLEPLLASRDRPEVPGSEFTDGELSADENWELAAEAPASSYSRWGDSETCPPSSQRSPGTLAQVPPAASCLSSATSAGFLHLPASVPHSPAWAFWPHSPSKPLASKPCLGSTSQERYT